MTAKRGRAGDAGRPEGRAAGRAGKTRLDVLLHARGLAESRERAQALIMAGRVLLRGIRADKPGTPVAADAALEVTAPLPYVSRGGSKLRAGLDAFGVRVAGRVALDVGASTGGFTDCLLQAGAARVIAVDVGAGQMEARLRVDPRVVVLDRTNIRYLDRAALPAAPDLATIDVAFISLALVLPVVHGLLDPPREVVALVKPQFEVGKGEVGKGGVVRDPARHRGVLQRIGAAARAAGFEPLGAVPSPILGPKGNREFLVHLIGREAAGARGAAGLNWETVVEACLRVAAPGPAGAGA